MAKRISAVFFLGFILFMSVSLLSSILLGGYQEIEFSFSALLNGEFSRSIQSYTSERLPGRKGLEQLAISLRSFSGKVEVNGVFITDNMLMKNLEPPSEDAVEKNSEALLSFAQPRGLPCYLMLVPTACAIKQQALPDYVNLYNQKNFIENVYSEMGGAVSVVDIYLKLLANQSDYIYYRTHDNITSKGGYLIYEVLGKRLGITPIRALDQYDISYGKDYFYGDIFDKVPYDNVYPDRVTLYRFTKYRREYRVRHIDEDGIRSYYTLFPEFISELTNSYPDIILGGMSPIIEIKSTTTPDNRLLIFGDKTAVNYIPFLLVHYSDITLVDIASVTEQQLSLIDLDDFHQVLFGVSVDTYMHTDAFTKLSAFKE